MIRKARRLPIECEFVEYTGDNRDEVIEWLGDALMKSPMPDDPLLYIRYGENAEDFWIAGVGDYVVKDTNLSGECMFTAMYKEEFESNYMEEIHKEHDFPHYIRQPLDIERVGGKVIQHLSIDQKTVDHIFYKFKDVAAAYSPEMPKFIYEGYEMAFEYIWYLEEELKKCKDWIEKNMGD